MLKVGDVVCLNYNVKGPSMTVSRLDALEAECVWFDDSDKLHRDTFSRDILELEYDGEEEEEDEEA